MAISIGLRATAVAFRGAGAIGGRLAGRFLTPRALGLATRRAGIAAGRGARAGFRGAKKAGRIAHIVSPLDEIVALTSGKDLDFVKFQTAQVRDKLERQLRRKMKLPLRGAASDLAPHLHEGMNRAARRINAEGEFMAPEAIETIFREELAAAGKWAEQTVQTNFETALQNA